MNWIYDGANKKVSTIQSHFNRFIMHKSWKIMIQYIYHWLFLEHLVWAKYLKIEFTKYTLKVQKSDCQSG